MNVDIAYRLSKLRRDRGYSQEKLAEQLGVSRQAVSKWERAESSPDTDNLIALAELYGMSLDDLLKGGDAQTPDAMPAQDADAPNADDSAQAPCADVSDSSDESQQESSAAVPSGDHVHISWRNGIHVHDSEGAEVHVGWDGIHVTDPKEGSSVHVDGAGVNVQDGEGFDLHSDKDGGYTVNGTHYDNWDEAREAANRDHEQRAQAQKGGLEKFPYAVIALVAFLCIGIFADNWGIGLVVLFSTAIWMTFARLVTSCTHKEPAKKRREAATALVGTLFLWSFFFVGFVFDAWHPGWVLIVIGCAVCGIINACWHVNDAKQA